MHEFHFFYLFYGKVEFLCFYAQFLKHQNEFTWILVFKKHGHSTWIRYDTNSLSNRQGTFLLKKGEKKSGHDTLGTINKYILLHIYMKIIAIFFIFWL